MTFIMLDGFDSIPHRGRWDRLGGAYTLQPGRREGSLALGMTTGDFVGKEYPTPGRGYYMSFAFKMKAFPSSYRHILARHYAVSGWTTVMSVAADGILGVTGREADYVGGSVRGDYAVQTPLPIELERWYHVEWWGVIRQEMHLAVDGVQMESYYGTDEATGEYDQDITVAYVYCDYYSGTGASFWVDDCVMGDASQRWGDMAVETRTVNAIGDDNQWTTPNATDVVEAVKSLPAYDLTTWAEASTVGDKQAWHLEDTGVSGPIRAVQAGAYLTRKGVNESLGVQAYIKDDTTTALGTAYDFADGPQYVANVWESPPSGGSWTPEKFDAFQVGLEVIP